MKNGIETGNGRLVGLDLGTSNVSFVVCEEQPERGIELLGIGVRPSQGMQKGMVSNIDTLVDSIVEAKSVAEQMAMCEIDRVFVGITGSHIRGTNSTGVVAIRGAEVTENDIERVSESAQAVPISSNEMLLHTISQQYIIDGQPGIQHPLGMCGVRLEAKVHVVAGSASPIENILKCVRLCDIEVEGVILNHIASGQAVLSDDEKTLGVAMLDIGEGTTDLALYSEGSIVHSATFPFAGIHITQDIAVSLHTPTEEANRVKKHYGSAISRNMGSDETFELIVIGDSQPSRAHRRYLAEVIEARLEEIFLMVRDHLQKSGQTELIRAGLVLTGGTSKMVDISRLANRILNVPVRLGTANYSGELSELVKDPGYSTGIGLCEYGHFLRREGTDLINKERQEVSEGMKHRVSGAFRKLFMREHPSVYQSHSQ